MFSGESENLSLITLSEFFRMFYYPRVMGLQEQEICIDPKYQREGQDADKEGTYYPQGVVCYTDPSEGKNTS